MKEIQNVRNSSFSRIGFSISFGWFSIIDNNPYFPYHTLMEKGEIEKFCRDNHIDLMIVFGSQAKKEHGLTAILILPSSHAEKAP